MSESLDPCLLTASFHLLKFLLLLPCCSFTSLVKVSGVSCKVWFTMEPDLLDLKLYRDVSESGVDGLDLCFNMFLAGVEWTKVLVRASMALSMVLMVRLVGVVSLVLAAVPY